MVIGLLGGSFDPAHEGHAHITREALKRMGLDQVWWLVTPGQSAEGATACADGGSDRAAQGQVMQHPRVKITALEEQFWGRGRRLRRFRPAAGDLSRRHLRLADGGG